MWENLKIGFFLLVLVALFFLIAPYTLNLIGEITSKPQITVEYPTEVHGRITGSYVSRQYHRYYLDGNTKKYYDFNALTQPLTPAQQQMGEEEQVILVLGQLLETGDIVSKTANSTVLTVQRGDSTSRWFCSTKTLSD